MGQLTTAQLSTLKTEIQNDPQALGYASYLTTSDWTNLASLLDFLRDGVTPCPVNSVVGNVTFPVTGATNATPIVITATGHGLNSNQSVVISGVGGNAAANGTFIITKIDANTFSLNASVGSGAYTSGGTYVVGVRNPNVTNIAVIGATKATDLITNGGATALTADQAGKLAFFTAIINQPSGSIQLTNPDGTDTNTIINLRIAFTANTASRLGINAIANRVGSRAEVLLGLSATSPGQLLGSVDVAAANAGHY